MRITEKENENLGGVYSYYDEKTKSYGFLYPEITGYFLSTLRFLHSLEPNDDLVKLAKNSANWLIKIHQNYGGIVQGLNTNESKQKLVYSHFHAI